MVGFESGWLGIKRDESSVERLAEPPGHVGGKRVPSSSIQQSSSSSSSKQSEQAEQQAAVAQKEEEKRRARGAWPGPVAGVRIRAALFFSSWLPGAVSSLLREGLVAGASDED